MKTLSLLIIGLLAAGCRNDSDSIQSDQQERLLAEGTAQVGMPSIKNFRERKLAKDILELRDQNGLITYTYVENELPRVVPGRTVLGGKFTFLGESVGYGLPYATQFTSPEKLVFDKVAVPQADPNGLFSPSSAEGTWVSLRDPNGGGTKALYIESRVMVAPFKFALD